MALFAIELFSRNLVPTPSSPSLLGLALSSAWTPPREPGSCVWAVSLSVRLFSPLRPTTRRGTCLLALPTKSAVMRPLSRGQQSCLDVGCYIKVFDLCGWLIDQRHLRSASLICRTGSPRQPRCSSVVEHLLAKERVESSNLSSALILNQSQKFTLNCLYRSTLNSFRLHYFLNFSILIKIKDLCSLVFIFSFENYLQCLFYRIAMRILSFSFVQPILCSMIIFSHCCKIA